MITSIQIKVLDNLTLATHFRYCTSGRAEGCVKNGGTYFTYAECTCTTDGCNRGSMRTLSVEVKIFTYISLAFTVHTMKFVR